MALFGRRDQRAPLTPEAGWVVVTEWRGGRADPSVDAARAAIRLHRREDERQVELSDQLLQAYEEADELGAEWAAAWVPDAETGMAAYAYLLRLSRDGLDNVEELRALAEDAVQDELAEVVPVELACGPAVRVLGTSAAVTQDGAEVVVEAVSWFALPLGQEHAWQLTVSCVALPLVDLVRVHAERLAQTLR